MDEVQTGFGLGGTFLWHHRFGLVDKNGAPDVPDCVVFAKRAQVGVCMSRFEDPEPTNAFAGSPSAANVVFDNLASALGVDLGGWSWGAQFGDLNNDGTMDLYLTNGYVSAGDRSSYWYDFAEIAVGHSRIIGDAANWPAMKGRSLSGYQRKRVWLNDGAGRFVDVREV